MLYLVLDPVIQYLDQIITNIRFLRDLLTAFLCFLTVRGAELAYAYLNYLNFRV